MPSDAAHKIAVSHYPAWDKSQGQNMSYETLVEKIDAAIRDACERQREACTKGFLGANLAALVRSVPLVCDEATSMDAVERLTREAKMAMRRYEIETFHSDGAKEIVGLHISEAETAAAQETIDSLKLLKDSDQQTAQSAVAPPESPA